MYNNMKCFMLKITDCWHIILTQKKEIPKCQGYTFNAPLVHTFNPCILEAEAERKEGLCEFEASQNDRVKIYQKYKIKFKMTWNN